MANLNAFYETRNLFIQYTHYIKPLTFEQWAVVPADQKSAVLFVQFFSQICQAWNKANAYDFIPGEDGVSVMCQYLEKNIAKILDEPKRFTSAYIYRVAYNCMYCICHDLKHIKDRWENETSNIVGSGEDQLDLFDILTSNPEDAFDNYDRLSFQARFWGAIEDAGLEAEKVIEYLLTNDPQSLKARSPRSKVYKMDPLRDVEVSLESVAEILDDLRSRLAWALDEM